jgi:hypothetical protein
VCRESMDFLVSQIRALEPKLEAYQQYDPKPRMN